MAGIVNIGSFRDYIQVFYESGSTVSPLGSTVQTLSNLYVHADVNQMDGRQSVYLGLNRDTRAYSVKFRSLPMVRPVKIVYNGEEMQVISTNIDKLNRFMNLIVKSAI